MMKYLELAKGLSNQIGELTSEVADNRRECLQTISKEYWTEAKDDITYANSVLSEDPTDYARMCVNQSEDHKLKDLLYRNNGGYPVERDAPNWSEILRRIPPQKEYQKKTVGDRLSMIEEALKKSEKYREEGLIELEGDDVTRWQQTVRDKLLLMQKLVALG